MRARQGRMFIVQKPLAFTIKEALKMVRVARDNKRVVQVGSQQRSSREFIRAIELVQTGKIGHIEKIYARVGDPPKPLDLPEVAVPANLNWNLWVGPLMIQKSIIIPIYARQFLLTLKKMKNSGVPGAGIAKQETDLQPTGVHICSTFRRQPLVWTDQALARLSPKDIKVRAT